MIGTMLGTKWDIDMNVTFFTLKLVVTTYYTVICKFGS